MMLYNTKYTKISTIRKLPAIRYRILCMPECVSTGIVFFAEGTANIVIRGQWLGTLVDIRSVLQQLLSTLPQLEHFIGHLHSSTVNQIFPKIADGFSDTIPAMREQTVKVSGEAAALIQHIVILKNV